MIRKFLIWVLICFSSINSYSKTTDLKKLNSPEARWLYADALHEMHKDGKINDNEYIQKSKECYEYGIGFCAVNISGLYYSKKDYVKARIWAEKVLNNHESTLPGVPSASDKAYFGLGLMYREGYGVLQNYDKAISYLKKGAKNGETLLMIEIAHTYLMKAKISSGSEAIENHKNAYAWLKIAQSLPEDQSVMPIKQTQEIIREKLDILRSILQPSLKIQEADKLAEEICPTIFGCST